MIEVWKQHLNKGNQVGVLVMDLPKALDTINHSLLLAKLETYGFSANSLINKAIYVNNFSELI